MHLLLKGIKAFDLNLSPEQVEAFETYYTELRVWNPKAGLTAIVSYTDVQRKHFVDSLSVFALPEFRRMLEADPSLRVLDVGTGAGFPGIPIKIVAPQIRLALLESIGKKVRFLKHIVEKLELSEVEILHGRAEVLAHQERYREQFDVVVARAVAEMAVLVEYALPFCRQGGLFVAYKGPKAPAEVEAARDALEILGGRVIRMTPVPVEGLAEKRILVLVGKEKPTPTRYPRRPGIPAKRPLGVKGTKSPSRSPDAPSAVELSS